MFFCTVWTWEDVKAKSVLMLRAESQDLCSESQQGWNNQNEKPWHRPDPKQCYCFSLRSVSFTFIWTKVVQSCLYRCWQISRIYTCRSLSQVLWSVQVYIQATGFCYALLLFNALNLCCNSPFCAGLLVLCWIFPPKCLAFSGLASVSSGYFYFLQFLLVCLWHSSMSSLGLALQTGIYFCCWCCLLIWEVQAVCLVL